MPTVSHKLTRPGGAALADETVHIRLLASTTGEAEGFVASMQTGILSEYKTRTDSTGTWSVALTANALITPANTVYQVIQPGLAGGKVTEHFIVPNGAGPYWLGDILAEVPGTLASAALDVHNDSVSAHAGELAPASHLTDPAAHTGTLATQEELNAASVATMFDRPIAGSWFVPLGTATAISVANFVGGCWLFVPVATPIDRIGIEVTTVGAAGDTVALALYKKGTGSSTLTRVYGESAALPIDTLGFKEAILAQTLAPGRYAAVLRTVTTGAPQLRGRTGAAWPGFYPADTTELASDMRSGIHPIQIGFPSSGAPLPAALTLVLGSRSHAPLIYVRAA